MMVRSLSEVFAVSAVGIGLETTFNSLVWYISAMLITMLPLSFLLIKSKDFFLYIFSPLTALFALGFMYQSGDIVSTMQLNRYCIFTGGIIRALSGLCFGAVAYIIYEKLREINNKRYNVILTICEGTGWILLFCAWFVKWILNCTSKETLFCAVLILPLLIAIAFSGKSYISYIFKLKCFKYAGILSETIYLNHMTGIVLISALCPDINVTDRLIQAVLFTAVFGAANIIVVKIIKRYCRKE